MTSQATHHSRQCGSVLSGRRVLVVEDEYVMAENLCEALVAQGAEVVGPVPTAAEALALLTQGPAPHLVLLDVDLQDERVYIVVDRIRLDRIPCIFVTGYDPEAIPAEYADVPRVDKPVEIQQILTKVSGE
nr:response regulator [Paracoccus albicereus]